MSAPSGLLDRQRHRHLHLLHVARVLHRNAEGELRRRLHDGVLVGRERRRMPPSPGSAIVDSIPSPRRAFFGMPAVAPLMRFHTGRSWAIEARLWSAEEVRVRHGDAGDAAVGQLALRRILEEVVPDDVARDEPVRLVGEQGRGLGRVVELRAVCGTPAAMPRSPLSRSCSAVIISCCCVRSAPGALMPCAFAHGLACRVASPSIPSSTSAILMPRLCSSSAMNCVPTCLRVAATALHLAHVVAVDALLAVAAAAVDDEDQQHDDDDGADDERRPAAAAACSWSAAARPPDRAAPAAAENRRGSSSGSGSSKKSKSISLSRSLMASRGHDCNDRRGSERTLRARRPR